MHSITHSFVGLCILLLAFETIDLNFMHLFFFFLNLEGGEGWSKVRNLLTFHCPFIYEHVQLFASS